MVIVSPFDVVSWCVFVFWKNFIFWHFSGHEFWPTWQDFHENRCDLTGHNFFLGHFMDWYQQLQIVPLVSRKAYVKFQVFRSSLSERLCSQFSKLHYHWNWFSKISDFFYFDNFYLHEWLKWSLRTSKAASRIVEVKPLRVTPFPFVRRAMGTANSFKTKRSKLKSSLRSGNQVAYGQ